MPSGQHTERERPCIASKHMLAPMLTQHLSKSCPLLPEMFMMIARAMLPWRMIQVPFTRTAPHCLQSEANGDHPGDCDGAKIPRQTPGRRAVNSAAYQNLRVASFTAMKSASRAQVSPIPTPTN
jgi:hypothetical protein